MPFKVLYGLAAGLIMCHAAPVFAGIYSDELGKCLVNSTTKDDRVDLMRWLFVAASHHPAVKPITSVSPAQQEESDRKTGALFMKLLTVSCKTETQKALRGEGIVTIKLAFEVLGKLAGQELFSSPEVTGNMQGLAKYIDADKIKALASEQGNPP
jgi:hypothetical protein